MAEFVNMEFTGVTIRMDGNQYRGCRFRDCVIEFGATAPMDIAACDIDNCRVEIVDNALAGLKFLYQLYHSGQQALVEEWVTQLRTPPAAE